MEDFFKQMEDFFKQIEDLNRHLEWPADSEIEHVNPEVYKKIKKEAVREAAFRVNRMIGDHRNLWFQGYDYGR